jgi:glycosyltransferase involved in cell wall biosynthesis
MNPEPPAPSRSSVSFIVLALNEEREITGTVNAIRQAAADSEIANYQIILVNDGSTDSTGPIMDRLAASDEKLTVVHNERNLGLGGAYKRGLARARCDYVMIVAGDNVMPASDMSLVLSRLGEADIVLPYLTNPTLRPLGRRIGSRGFTTLINILFGLRVRYYQGMIPRRVLLQTITIETDSYAFPAEVTVKLLKAGCSYVDVGISSTPTSSARSVALQPRRLWAVFKAVVNLVRAVRRPGAIPSVSALTAARAATRDL